MWFVCVAKVYVGHPSPKDRCEILAINADGSDQRLLPRSYGFTWPCCSPDGRQILSVNTHAQICLASAAGTYWRRLTSVSGGIGWVTNTTLLATPFALRCQAGLRALRRNQGPR